MKSNNNFSLDCIGGRRFGVKSRSTNKHDEDQAASDPDSCLQPRSRCRLREPAFAALDRRVGPTSWSRFCGIKEKEDLEMLWMGSHCRPSLSFTQINLFFECGKWGLKSNLDIGVGQ